jgi:all-trans-retinol dehydrogenase (NAD+)
MDSLPSSLQRALGPAVDFISSFLTTPSTARTLLIAYVTLRILSRVNRHLSRRLLNNYNLSHPWHWHSRIGGEIVLITGGSSGLGELVVRKLAARDVRVAVLDLQPPQTPFPDSVRFYQGDVTSTAQVHEAAEKMRADFPGEEVTVLVNNAGVGSARSILDGTEEETRKTLEVNLLAHFVTIREFLPAMVKKDHGHVVAVASAASFVTIAGNADYSCSKVGVLALHEGLGQELKHRYAAPNVRTR